MVRRVVLKFFGEGSLSSMSVFQLVDEAGRRGHKISKVRVEGIVGKGNEDIGAEAGGWGAGRVIPVDHGGCLRLERVELVHPGGRLGVFICDDICNLSVGVLGDSRARSSGKAIPHRVVEEVVRIEVQARGGVEPKGVPHLGAGAQRWLEKGKHSVPGEGI